MKAKKIWANYSVKNAEATRQFYHQLGIKPNGANNAPQLASFIFGDDTLVIHFFEQGSKIDNFITGGTYGEIMFTLAADTEVEVNECAEKVKMPEGIF